MKTLSPVYIALAVMLTATSAYGQYRQQSSQPTFPQQSWRAPISQASTLQQQAVPQPTPEASQSNAGSAYNSVVGGAGSACCDDGQCGGQSCSGGGCGLGSRLRNSGGYDPCNPIKYVSLYGGGSTFQDIVLELGVTDPTGASQGIEAILQQNNGWGIGAAVGRSLGRRFRVEFDWTYRNASLDTVGLNLNGVSQGNTALDGQLNVYSGLTNLLWDFNPGGRLNAYVGAGTGVAFYDLDAVETTTPVSARITGSSWAYQGILGLSGRLSCRTDMFLEYRYFASDKLEVNASAPIGAASASVDLASNDVFVGFRIKR